MWWRKQRDRPTVSPALTLGVAGTQTGTHPTLYQGCGWIKPSPSVLKPPEVLIKTKEMTAGEVLGYNWTHQI